MISFTLEPNIVQIEFQKYQQPGTNAQVKQFPFVDYGTPIRKKTVHWKAYVFEEKQSPTLHMFKTVSSMKNSTCEFYLTG